jgi:hypothetical protein
MVCGSSAEIPAIPGATTKAFQADCRPQVSAPPGERSPGKVWDGKGAQALERLTSSSSASSRPASPSSSFEASSSQTSHPCLCLPRLLLMARSISIIPLPEGVCQVHAPGPGRGAAHEGRSLEDGLSRFAEGRDGRLKHFAPPPGWLRHDRARRCSSRAQDVRSPGRAVAAGSLPGRASRPRRGSCSTGAQYS